MQGKKVYRSCRFYIFLLLNNVHFTTFYQTPRSINKLLSTIFDTMDLVSFFLIKHRAFSGSLLMLYSDLLFSCIP